MQAIFHRFPETIVLAVLQGVHQREHTLHVENRVGSRYFARQRCARLGGSESNGGRRHDELQIPRP
jgi:hypothetical protein